jgi:hypothetical protein
VGLSETYIRSLDQKKQKTTGSGTEDKKQRLKKSRRRKTEV